MTSDLIRFYALLDSLETQTPNQGRPLADYTGRVEWPRRGVYFFREAGEVRGDSVASRIVRVGTHAVSANSKSTLWNRLRAHRGNLNGTGNHRGSVFRLHVGAALIRRDPSRFWDEVATWGKGSSAPKEVRAAERALESAVSEFLCRMTVLWVDVPDEPGTQSVRAFIEQNAIALLSNRQGPLDRPSKNWLGLHSPKSQIARSGLWNLDYVDGDHDPSFLSVFEEAVRRTLKS